MNMSEHQESTPGEEQAAAGKLAARFGAAGFSAAPGPGGSVIIYAAGSQAEQLLSLLGNPASRGESRRPAADRAAADRAMGRLFS